MRSKPSAFGCPPDQASAKAARLGKAPTLLRKKQGTIKSGIDSGRMESGRCVGNRQIPGIGHRLDPFVMLVVCSEYLKKKASGMSADRMKGS